MLRSWARFRDKKAGNGPKQHHVDLNEVRTRQAPSNRSSTEPMQIDSVGEGDDWLNRKAEEQDNLTGDMESRVRPALGIVVTDHQSEYLDVIMEESSTVEPSMEAFDVDAALAAFDDRMQMEDTVRLVKALPMSTTGQPESPSLPSYGLERHLTSFQLHLESLDEKVISKECDGDLVRGQEEASTTHLGDREREQYAEEILSFCRPLLLYGRDHSSVTISEQDAFTNLLESIRTVVQDENVITSRRSIRSLLHDVSSLLRIIRPVDVNKLIKLLQRAKITGDDIADKDILLLIGSSGCGKTTTLLFLAGTTFEEVEVDGFDHLRPIDFPDQNLVDYATSCGTKSVTNTIQSVAAAVKGEPIRICDTPGFFDTGGVECDIANGYGMIRAIHRARTVKPTLVLSKEGDRLRGISQVLEIVKRLLGGKKDVDLSPFDYIFTKYEKRKVMSITKQFSSMKRDFSTDEERDRMLVSIVDDIIEKTADGAHIVVPLEDDAQDLLQSLWSNSERQVRDPASYFSQFIDKQLLVVLELQLKMTVGALEAALNDEDFDVAHLVLTQLTELASVLPEAVQYNISGLAKAKDYVLGCRMRVDEINARFRDVVVHKNFVMDVEMARVAMETTMKSESVRVLCMPTDPSSAEFCEDAVKAMMNTLMEDIKGTTDWFQSKDAILSALVRLTTVDEMFYGSQWERLTNSLQQKAVDAFLGIVESILLDFETVYPKSAEELKVFESRAALSGFFIRGFLKHSNRDDCQKVNRFEIHWVGALNALDVRVKEASILSEANWLPQDGRGRDVVPLLSYLNVQVESFRSPRELLLLVSRMPFLCTLLPSRPSPSDLKQAALTIDSALIDFLGLLASSAEKEYARLDCRKEEVVNFTAAREEAKLISEYLKEVEIRFTVLRTMSNRVSRETEDDLKRLISLVNRLEQHIASLDESAHKLVESLTGAYAQAQGFEQRLRTNGSPGKILADLIETHSWENWETVVGKESTLLGALFRGEAQRTVENLKRTMHRIASHLRSCLERAATNLSSIIWEKYDGRDIVKLVLHQSSSTILFFLEFLRLNRTSSSLTETILAPGRGIPQKLASAEGSLSVGFLRLSLSIHSTLQRQNFEALNEALNLMQTSIMWKAAVGFARTTIGGGTSQEKLLESILKCGDYDSLREDTLKRLRETEQTLSGFSFEHTVHTVNELDRNQFFSGLADTLVAASTAGCLVNHVPDNLLSCLQTTCSTAKDRILVETKKVGSRGLDLLSTFPKHEQDFPLLNAVIGTLSSIGTAFRYAFAEASGLAEKQRRTTDKKLVHRIQLMEPSSDANNDNMLHDLLLLKKASHEIGCWRIDIDKAIDSILEAGAKESQNAGYFLLSLSLDLENVTGDDAAVARRLLSEHRCFDGAVNAAYNDATARQGIEYVLQRLGIPSAGMDQMRLLYDSFQIVYRALVKRGMVILKHKNAADTDEFFHSLVDRAKNIAGDFSVDYAEQVSELSAHVFAYWTLKNTNAFAVTSEDEDGISKYSKIPHAAQVIAIWGLLRVSLPDHQELENHLIEVRTGEGKSIVLGVTGIILALLDCEVSCVCYSSYLSDRDYSDFENMFMDFGVLDRIHYSTIQNLCEQLINQEGGIRDLSSDFIHGNVSMNHRGSQSDSKSQLLKVLLVDEVDVFFKDDFYGSTHRPAMATRDSATQALMRYVWKNRDTLTEEELRNSWEAQQCLRSFASDLHPLIVPQFNRMLKDARIIGRGTETTPYIVSEGMIGYKYLDGLTFTTYYGYETAFAYLKESENGKISESTVNEKLGMNLACGEVSFAELPVSFDVILGVTGTLKGLSTDEKNTLHQVYDIEEHSYIPSVYGENKLMFKEDSERDVIPCRSKDDFFLELRSEIDRRRRPTNGAHGIRRSVMVFFDSSKTLLEFYRSDVIGDLRSVAQTITEDIAGAQKDALFRKATDQGAVSLLIREYGRGTDFKCHDEAMLNAGGVHVIQAFYAPELAEEIQIKGRGARQGKEGSYSMVLNASQLASDLGVNDEEFETMRKTTKFCSFLKKRRNEKFSEKLLATASAVREAESKHYQSLAYVKAVLDGADRAEACRFLLEINQCGGHGAFAGTDLKRTYINERKQRLEKRQQLEQERRRKKKKPVTVWSVASFVGKERGTRNFDLNRLRKMNHYQILGIEKDAIVIDVVRAHRTLSKECHPDKCSEEGATEYFQLITNARDVLVDDMKRAEYDRELDESQN